MKKIALILFAAVAMAMAESIPFTHDGFFLNVSLGFGGQAMSMTGEGMMDGNKMTFDGDRDGGVFEIDYKAGGRILPFTILHATVLQIRGGLDVHAEYRGMKKDNEYAEAMFLYGIGATYYIYPHNFFVTSSLGMVSFGLPEDSGKREARSEFGFGFQLGFGKEWWVSENWGIGASFAVNCGSVDEDEEDFEFSAFAITLMLTATYN